MSFFDPRSPVEWFRDTVDRVRTRNDAPAPLHDVYRLELREQADLGAVASMPRGPERRAAAWRELQDVARRTQPEVRSQLEEWKQSGLVQAFEGHALVNAIEVVVPAEQREAFLEHTAKLDAVKDVVTVVEAERPGDEPGESPDPGSEGTPRDDRDSNEPATPSRPVAVPGTDDFVDGISWGNKQIRADEAWSKGVDGRGIVVGLLDTGIDVDHPAFEKVLDRDLDRSTAPGTDRDDPGSHGTHTGGTVAGSLPGMKFGAAPGAEIRMASMKFGEHGGTLGSDFLGAMEWMLAPGSGDPVFGTRDAARGVDVLSNSWGSGPGSADEEGGDGYSLPIRHLDAAGIVQVFAAGNDGPTENTLSQPADRPEVIAVAATARDGKIADFSSRGGNPRGTKAGPDISAPGEGVSSSFPIGLVDDNMILTNLAAKAGLAKGYGPVKGTKGALWNMSGTSMAAPHVAGVAALVLQQNPTLSPAQVRSAIEASAVDIGAKGRDTVAGAGLVDVPAALEAAAKLAAGAA